MRKDKDQLFGVIGLGRFGFALAQGLAEAGKEIVVIDSDENKIREAAALTDNAFTVFDLDRNARNFGSGFLFEGGIVHDEIKGSNKQRVFG